MRRFKEIPTENQFLHNSVKSTWCVVGFFDSKLCRTLQALGFGSPKALDREKMKGRQAERETGRQTYKQRRIEGLTERDGDGGGRQVCRQTNRQTDRQNDRRINREE